MVSGRRGQLTIFVIIVLVIVAVVGLLFFMGQDNADIENSSTAFSGEVVNRITICLEDLTLEAIDKMAKQGGFVYPYESSYGVLEFSLFEDEIDSITAYGYFDGKNVLIGKDGLEWQIKRNIENEFNDCVGFDRFGFDIEEDMPWVFVDVEDDLIDVDMNYSFVIQKGESSVWMSEVYNYNANSFIGRLVGIGHDICSNLEDNNGFVSSDVLDLDVNVTLIPVDSDNSVFVLGYDKDVFIFGSRRGVE